MSQASSWQPVLSDADRASADALIARIAADLSSWLRDAPHADRAHSGAEGELSGRETGVSLFFLELWRRDPRPRFYQLALDGINRSFTRLAHGIHGPGLFTGIAGVAWLGQLVAAAGRRSEDNEGNAQAADDFDQVDAALLQYVQNRGADAPIDLMVGLAGIGTYCAARMPRLTAHATIDLLLVQLQKMAVRTDSGLAWPVSLQHLPTDYNRDRFGPGTVPIGVAHGMAGILAALSKMAPHATDREAAYLLFNEATRFVLSHRFPSSSPWTFAPAVREDGTFAEPNLSWCWGEPGTICALYGAARRMCHRELEAACLEAAIKLAATDPAATSARDSCLCHGSAGTAHLLNRLYQATSRSDLASLSQAWFRAVLDSANSDGYGGLLFSVLRDEVMVRAPSVGLLVGSAGVGLALLAATSSQPPLWDAPIGVDIPTLLDDC